MKRKRSQAARDATISTFARRAEVIRNAPKRRARLIEAERLLRYLVEHSNARRLLSDGFKEDVQTWLADGDSDG